MPECRTARHPVSSVPKWKKYNGPVQYRIKPAQTGIFLVQYWTEIIDAGKPMPALVSNQIRGPIMAIVCSSTRWHGVDPRLIAGNAIYFLYINYWRKPPTKYSRILILKDVLVSCTFFTNHSYKFLGHFLIFICELARKLVCRDFRFKSCEMSKSAKIQNGGLPVRVEGRGWVGVAGVRDPWISCNSYSFS
jgi:hypothetical protein